MSTEAEQQNDFHSPRQNRQLLPPRVHETVEKETIPPIQQPQSMQRWDTTTQKCKIDQLTKTTIDKNGHNTTTRQ